MLLWSLQAARASASAAEKKIQQQQREIEALKQKADRLEDALKESEKRAVDFDASRKELRESVVALKKTHDLVAEEKRETERRLTAAHETMQHLETQLQEKETALDAAIRVRDST